MNHRIALTILLVVSGATCLRADWPKIELPETDPNASITTYPEEYLDYMDDRRRTAGGAGMVFIYPEAVKRAKQYRAMLDEEGPAAMARAMVEAYPTKDATMTLAAGAIAMAARTGYMAYGFGANAASTVKEFALPKEYEDQLARKQKALPELLPPQVNPVIDEVLKIDSPYAKDTAAELLLQLFSETLMSSHIESHNGRRNIEPMPRELTARAASMLGDEDPFIHAIAEWAVEVNVGNENEGGGTPVWPGKTPPDWWDAWAGESPERFLALDYARQAICMGMHRSGEDLLTLSKDQMHRAEQRAAWATPRLGKEQVAELENRIAAMKQAHAIFAKVVADTPDDLTACRKAFLQWRPSVRAVVMIGPDLDFESVLYATRYSGGPHGQPGAHLFKAQREGGDIYIQTGLDPASSKTPLIADQLPPRYVQDLDLWYDAHKLVFAASHAGRNFQLWEVGIDGSNLTRLTDNPYDDCDVAYLPDGGVVFGSTEARAGVMCGGGSNSHTNIYRLSADRQDRIRLSYCKDDDAYPYVLNDGRIVFMRWDYQERGVNDIFSLWVIRPDGTGADAFYRVHIPMDYIVQTLRDPLPIEGSEKIIATGGSHRTENEGQLILADPTMGINNPLGIRTVTPYCSATTYGVGELMRPVQEGGVPYMGGLVTKPRPLSEKSFLASICYDMPQSANFGLYYIDVWGNKELIHRDKLLETACAIPLKPRQQPPILPDMSDRSKTYATCYVDNVYSELPGVQKGEVKYIRILEQLFWYPADGGPLLFQGPWKQQGGTGQGPTRIVGLVPVHEDGSAFFQCPSDMPVYFQALDKNFRGLQRMRTHVEFAPGENRSCIGCHETKNVAVPNRPQGMALLDGPVRPEAPWWGDSTFIGYEKHIQPIWDAKCLKCHDEENAKGGLVLTAKKDKAGYMQSYRSLFGLGPGQSFPSRKTRRKFQPAKPEVWDAMNDRVTFIVKFNDGVVNPPMALGAPQAPLATKLVSDEKHRQLLTDKEMQIIMAWLDVRTPYSDTYSHKKKAVEVKPFAPFGEVREHDIPVPWGGQ